MEFCIVPNVTFIFIAFTLLRKQTNHNSTDQTCNSNNGFHHGPGFQSRFLINLKKGTMQNASKLVSIAESISCDVDLCYGRYIVDAKSMLGVLSLPDFAYGELQIPVETEAEKRQILEKLAEAGLLYEKKQEEKKC